MIIFCYKILGVLETSCQKGLLTLFIFKKKGENQKTNKSLEQYYIIIKALQTVHHLLASILQGSGKSHSLYFRKVLEYLSNLFGIRLF